MSHSLAVRHAAFGSVELPAGSSLTRVREVLDTFAARDLTGEVLTAVRYFPAREAQCAEFPTWVNPDLIAAYGAKGIRQPNMRLLRLQQRSGCGSQGMREGVRG